MINDAEKFKEEDMKSKERVDAKNELESYLYTTKNMITKEDMKISEDKRKLIMDNIEEKIKWLDDNMSASTEEFKDVKKEIEEFVTNELKTMSSDTDEPSFNNTSEPKIEEVD